MLKYDKMSGIELREKHRTSSAELGPARALVVRPDTKDEVLPVSRAFASSRSTQNVQYSTTHSSVTTCGERYNVTSSELFDGDGPCTGGRIVSSGKNAVSNRRAFPDPPLISSSVLRSCLLCWHCGQGCTMTCVV
jgi:hypothetical protein